MKRSYFLFLCLSIAIISGDLHAQELQWAGKVLAFSSQVGEKQHSADQILGPPNVYPDHGHNVGAWSPALKSNYSQNDWIMVAFLEPQFVEQVMVVENNGPGSIVKMVLYDTEGLPHSVMGDFSYEGYSNSNRILRVKFYKTTFKVAALKLVLETSLDYEWNNIDAVGIVNSRGDLLIKPKLLDGFSMQFGREEMSYGVNTSGQDIMPVLSPDGKELFMDRKDNYENMGDSDNDDVWKSTKRIYANFQAPENIGPPINNSSNNFLIALCDEGNLAILGNVYQEDGTMTSGVSACRRESGVWGTPFKLEIEDFSNLSGFVEYHMSDDTEILILAIERSEGLGDRDLYASFKIDDTHYGAPIHLGPKVNSSHKEMTPWISPNKKYLIFSSLGQPGYGDSDLYASKRLDDSWQNWSDPINLGPAINSQYWDAYFTASPGTPYAYFCSVKGSMGVSDIFKIKLPDLLRREFGLIK